MTTRFHRSRRALALTALGVAAFAVDPAARAQAPATYPTKPVTMLVPAAAGLRGGTPQPEVFAMFGATWLAVITFAIVGNYPTPLVGYGSSAILGYCLSAPRLTR